MKTSFLEIKDILVVTAGKNGDVIKGVYADAKQAVANTAAGVKGDVGAFKDSVSEKAKLVTDKVKSLLPGKSAAETEVVVPKAAAPKKARTAKALAV